VTAAPVTRDPDDRRLGERGFFVVWGMGLVILLFGFAGIAVDTWQVFSARQALAGLADSAAIAGATAVDVEVFRSGGQVVLDETEATARAAAYLDTHAAQLDDDITAAIAFPDGGIEVTLQREVELTLIRVFLDDGTVAMRVSAFSLPGERLGP
jgi:hypothetical protein